MKSLRFSSWPVQLCPTTAWWTPSPPQVDVSSSSFRCGRWSARTHPGIFPPWKLGGDKSCLKIKIKENWEQVKSNPPSPTLTHFPFTNSQIYLVLVIVEFLNGKSCLKLQKQRNFPLIVRHLEFGEKPCLLLRPLWSPASSYCQCHPFSSARETFWGLKVFRC